MVIFPRQRSLPYIDTELCLGKEEYQAHEKGNPMDRGVPAAARRTLFLAFPVYNAMPGLLWVFKSLDWLETILDQLGIDLRVMFVVDPCTDDSQAQIVQFCSRRLYVALQVNETNMGNTHNVRFGERWAKDLGRAGDFYGSCDADGEFNVLDLLWFLDTLPQYGIVVGSVSYPPFRLTPGDATMMRELGHEQAKRAEADSPYTLQSPGFKLMHWEQLAEVVRWFTLFERFVGATLPRWGYHGAFLELAGRFAKFPIHVCFTACRGPAPNRSDEKRELQRQAAETYFALLDAFAAHTGLP
jgi:hypothetical protein